MVDVIAWPQLPQMTSPPKTWTFFFLGVYTAPLAFKPPVLLQNPRDFILLLSADDSRVVVLDRNPLRFLLPLLPVAILQDVVTVVAAVEDVAQDDEQG